MCWESVCRLHRLHPKEESNAPVWHGIQDSLNYTKAYYTPDGSYIASVSRLEDELRLSCAATGELVGAYRVRDRRPLDSLHCFTHTCRPDPFHPYRFAVLVDGWMAGATGFDSAFVYAFELPLAAPLQT